MENKQKDASDERNVPFPRLLMVFLLLLAAIGAPVATGAALWQWATQNAVFALVSLALYELFVLIATLTSKIWLRHEPAFLNWLDIRVVWLFSRYFRKYRQHLLDLYKDFDVKGLGIRGPFTLPLEEVFVELSVAPRVPGQVSPNPWPRSLEALSKGRHSIWEYLQANQHLAILGAPGTGKTTLLQHIAVILLEGRLRRKVRAMPKLPLVLFLREHARTIMATPDISLSALVDGQLNKRQHTAPPGWFEHQLRRGRCLVLLDGLDEVANSDHREQVVQWVEAQIENYGNNRFLLTSRPLGYPPKDRLSKVTLLEVQLFTREQISQFVTNWYLANEIKSAGNITNSSVQLRAKEGAQDLFRRLGETPELMELAVNPLLLTMLATVHRFYGALPGNRVDLYAKACSVFAGDRQEAKGIPLVLTSSQVQSILQPLAYQLMCLNQREISSAAAHELIAHPLELVDPKMSVDTFLTLVEANCGLLLEKERGIYGFAHKTFQEYLAAVHIKEQDLEQRLPGLVTDPWWHETIRLYAAQADASEVIEACLDTRPISAEALTLALACEGEAQKLLPSTRVRLQRFVEQGVEEKDPGRRRLMAEALLKWRLRQQWTRIDEDHFIATSLITGTEYEIYMDEQRNSGKWCQPDHWLASSFPANRGRDPVLGVRPSDAESFCSWLTERESGIWRYRMPYEGELALELLDQSLLNELTSGRCAWITTNADLNLIRWRVFKDRRLINTEPALNLTHNLDKVLKFFIDSSYARHLEQANDLIGNHNINSALNSALKHILSRDLTIAAAQYCANSIIGSFDLSRERIRARDLTSASMRTRDHALARDLLRASESFLKKVQNREIAFSNALAHVSVFAHSLDYNLAVVQNESISLIQDPRPVLLKLIRFSILLLVGAMLELKETTRMNKITLKKNNSIQPLQSIMIKAFLELYEDIVLVEARHEGIRPPFEGILILRERKHSNTDA